MIWIISGARKLIKEKTANSFLEEIKTKLTQKDIKWFIVCLIWKKEKIKEREDLPRKTSFFFQTNKSIICCI